MKAHKLCRQRKYEPLLTAPFEVRMSRSLLLIEKRSRPRLMLSDVGLAATAVAAGYRVVPGSIDRWLRDRSLSSRALTARMVDTGGSARCGTESVSRTAGCD